jgi:UDP-2,3-diacylglucosamine hydrolase
MPKTRTFVASDIHLGGGPDPEARERAFLTWLEAVAACSGRLVLNGDVFDFWFEYRSVIPRGHTRTLGLLAQMVDAGIPVDFVGGNHDWWGGSYLESEVGVRFHRAPVRLELAGRRTLVAHGDGLGAGDRGYRLLSSVIRHPLARTAFRWLHPDAGAALARSVSRTGNTPAPGGLASRVDPLERWARDELLADDTLQLVLLGHTHVPVLQEVTPGRFHVNSGDWIRNRTWVELSPDSPPRLCRWPELPSP